MKDTRDITWRRWMIWSQKLGLWEFEDKTTQAAQVWWILGRECLVQVLQVVISMGCWLWEQEWIKLSANVVTRLSCYTGLTWSASQSNFRIPEEVKLTMTCVFGDIKFLSDQEASGPRERNKGNSHWLGCREGAHQAERAWPQRGRAAERATTTMQLRGPLRGTHENNRWGQLRGRSTWTSGDCNTYRVWHGSIVELVNMACMWEHLEKCYWLCLANT